MVTRFRFHTTVAALAIALLALPRAARANVVFSKPPSPSGGVILSSWVDSAGSDSDMYAYDDFTLASTAAITEVRWRGGYSLGAPFGTLFNFTVTFSESIAGGSQPHVGNPQLEDTAPIYLAKYWVGGTAGETPAGTAGGVAMYDYAFVLPTPFAATAGVKYWIRIEASQPTYPDWGIAVGTGGDGSHFQFSTGAAMFSFGSNDASFSLLTAGSAPTPTVTPGSGATATATPTPTATATPTVTATPVPLLDHFACYAVGPSKGAAKFGGASGVSLMDGFGGSTVALKNTKYLCAPTDTLGGDPSAPAHTEHLTAYAVKPAGKFAAHTNLLVTDQLTAGGLRLDAKKPALLLVPSVKKPGGPTPPLPPSFATDHFQCYATAASKGAAKFVAAPGVTLADQFGSMVVDVQKPKLFCAPVDKNGEDPSAPTHPSHLACYQMKQVDAVKFAKQVGLFVNDQFGPQTLDAKKPVLLCVPAVVAP